MALINFSDSSTLVQPLMALSPATRASLKSRIGGLFADGGTAIYDTTKAALDLLKKDGNPNHIQAVVLLTDGEDNKSATKLDDLVTALCAPPRRRTHGCSRSPTGRGPRRRC